MRTTVDLPDSLFRQVKAHAASEGLKLKELIESVLSDYMKNLKFEEPAEEKLPEWEAPIETSKPIRAMTNDEIETILNEEEVKRYYEIFGGR